jgi:DNA-binding XRE family transcriptional regulator
VSDREFEDERDAAALRLAVVDPGDLVPMEVVDRLMAGEPPLRVWREHCGLTLDDLAAAAAVPQIFITDIENGRTIASESNLPLADVATVLHINVSDLLPWDLEEADAPPPSAAARRDAEERN